VNPSASASIARPIRRAPPVTATDLAVGGSARFRRRRVPALSIKMPGQARQWKTGQGFATIRADWLAARPARGEIRVGSRRPEIAGRFEGTTTRRPGYAHRHQDGRQGSWSRTV